ncbi:peptidoglycan DD-metalloendopeptidase family protein [Dermacoccaceae bacterium W4C1]
MSGSEQARAQARHRRQRWVAGVVVAGLSISCCAGALADDPNDRKKDIDKRIGKTQDDLDGVSKDLVEANNRLTQTNKKVAAARTTLSTAEGSLRSANRAYSDVNGRLKVAKANETKTLSSLKSNGQAQERTKVLVGGLARQSYMKNGMGGLETTLTILTSPSGTSSTDLSLAQIVIRQQSGVLSRLSGEQASGRAEANRLSGIRSNIAGLQRESAAAVTRAKTARNSAVKAKNSLEGLQKTQRSDADALAKRKKSEEADLKWLKGESTRLGDILKKRAEARAKARAAAAKKASSSGSSSTKSSSGSTNSAPRNDGHFLTGPRPKSQITSPFGYRMHPILNVPMLHGGSDFSFACGTPVYAAAAGEVIQAGFNSIGGNHVLIDHGDYQGKSYATQYDHLSKIVTRSGTVRKGQLVGYSGTTGRSTGCHLHFVVMVNGAYVNPANYIG